MLLKKNLDHLNLVLTIVRRKGRKENQNKRIMLKRRYSLGVNLFYMSRNCGKLLFFIIIDSRRKRHRRGERMRTVTMMIPKMIQEKNRVRKRKVDQTPRIWIQKKKKMIYVSLFKLYYVNKIITYYFINLIYFFFKKKKYQWKILKSSTRDPS